MAVTVDRDSSPFGGTMYVDGAVVFNFNPTGRLGSLANAANLWIGERQPISTVLFYEGLIDEVEIFNRVVPKPEILAIYLAGPFGKCKERCHIPWDVQFCNNDNTRPVTLTICNYATTGYWYNWSLAGLPGGGPGCNINGPTVFTPPAGSTFVPAGGCVNIPIVVTRPIGLNPPLVACYQMSITNIGTGHMFRCIGSVQAVDKWCIHKGVGLLDPVLLAVGDVQTLSFDVTNVGDPGGNLSYKIEVMSMDDEPPQVVSLNGLPPGTRYIGNLSVPMGQTGVIPVTVRFLEHAPFRFFDVFVDYFGDPSPIGDVLEFSDSIGIGSRPATSVTIAAANPPQTNPYDATLPFRDVLQNTTTALAPQGIGLAGTPSEGPYTYAPFSVTFSGTPTPLPTAANIMVSCTDIAGNGAGDCPGVSGISGSGAGPYQISLTAIPPVRECITFTFAGTATGQKLQFQNLPGDVNVNGSTTGQDVLSEVTAINNGMANLPGNLARYDANRNGAVTGQDVLRLVQLINGTSATQAFNGATVAACP